MKKKSPTSFTEQLLAQLPDDFNNLNDSHIAKIKNMLKFECDEIPIEKVEFKACKYRHYIEK